MVTPAGGGAPPPRGGGRPPAPAGTPPPRYACHECTADFATRRELIDHLALHAAAAAAATPAPTVDPEEAEIKRLKRELARINGQLIAKGKDPIATSDDLYELDSAVEQAKEKLAEANRPAPAAPAPHAAPHNAHGFLDKIWEAIDKGIDKGQKPFSLGRGSDEGGHHD